MEFHIADMKSERVGPMFLVTLDVRLVDTQYDCTAIPDEVMRRTTRTGCGPDAIRLSVQAFFDDLPTMTEAEWHGWLVGRLQQK
ncbi:hypothetical protein [Parasaccharibacter sp. TMW 2.1888]|uniref:hypothetical protein n=1 Tax=Parasaccharibacter sp. TMW 2.1888 TaxID=2268025 RepID=UPI0020C113FB|nr:hypothetical protein [Parasaccharibacter sp. TMW 2.1888]